MYVCVWGGDDWAAEYRFLRQPDAVGSDCFMGMVVIVHKTAGFVHYIVKFCDSV